MPPKKCGRLQKRKTTFSFKALRIVHMYRRHRHLHSTTACRRFALDALFLNVPAALASRLHRKVHGTLQSPRLLTSVRYSGMTRYWLWVIRSQDQSAPEVSHRRLCTTARQLAEPGLIKSRLESQLGQKRNLPGTTVQANFISGSDLRSRGSDSRDARQPEPGQRLLIGGGTSRKIHVPSCAIV